MIDNKEVEKVLKTVKQKIERAKEDLMEARSQKKLLLTSLKKDFNIENFIDADVMVKKLSKELETLSSDIETKYEELKNKFGFC